MKTIIHIFCLFISLAAFSQKKAIPIHAESVFLYRNIANIITVHATDLPKKKQILLTSTQAEVKQSTESENRFLVVPTGETCLIEVYSSNKRGKKREKIGEITQQVIAVPKPTIMLLMNEEAMSIGTKVPKGSRITVKIVPDSAYKSQYRNDSRYEIAQIDVFLDCGSGQKKVGGAVLTGRDATMGIDLPIPSDAYRCEGEGTVYFKIKDIYHKNFKGEIFVDSRFTEAEKTLIITVQK